MQKVAWLDRALEANPCDLFLTPQEYFGGTSTAELCRLKGTYTADMPVTEAWLREVIGDVARRHNVHIGIGATVQRQVRTEDFLYFDNEGQLLGYHSKMALPAQDSILLGGNSQIAPETDIERACTPVMLPALGLRVGTVFCWQVFFNDAWSLLAANGCNLIVNCIKFAPRAWYAKGETADGYKCRVGFCQEKDGGDPASDSLGWIRKLRAESEFKELPIAVTCNTWSGGEKYLALCGWVDEVTGKTQLFNVPSTPEAELVHVTTYDPTLYDELDHLSLGVYARFKEDWPRLMQGTMRRKAVRIERRARSGKTLGALEKVKFRPPTIVTSTQQSIISE